MIHNFTTLRTMAINILPGDSFLTSVNENACRRKVMFAAVRKIYIVKIFAVLRIPLSVEGNLCFIVGYATLWHK